MPRQANRATRQQRIGFKGILKDRRAAGRLSSMPRQANRATRTAADRIQRNPGLKDRRAAVRTSSTSKQANRAIKTTSGAASCGPSLHRSACRRPGRNALRPKLPQALADNVTERRHQGPFCALARHELIGAPTDPDPLDFDCGPSFRQRYRPHCPTLSIVPAGLKPSGIQ